VIILSRYTQIHPFLALWLLTTGWEWFILATNPNNLKEGNYAGILREVPRQKGDERPEVHHHEKWQTGHTGYMPGMRHQDVPNWKSLNKS
jgi:hypothetical protein